MTKRNLRAQTILIYVPQEMYYFLATPDVEVLPLLFASDQAVWISWQHSEQKHAPILEHTNDVIGSFVTAGARLHLYKYLDRQQTNAIYCDTDSVVYIQPKNEPDLIETVDCLGAMTSELKPGEHLSEFVSVGPKKYTYKSVNSVTGEQ